MTEYDSTRFDPPAPVALVIVRSKSLGVEIPEVPMLIDTGADVSLLPRMRVSQIVNPNTKLYQLEAFDGSRSVSQAVDAELEFLGKSFRGQFLLTEGWHGILGRNILNNVMIQFNGPRRWWAEPK